MIRRPLYRLLLALALCLPAWAQEEEQIAYLQNEKVRLEAHIKVLETQVQSLNALRANHQALSQQYKMLEQENAELRATIDRLGARIDALGGNAAEAAKPEEETVVRVLSPLDPKVLNADFLNTLASLNTDLVAAYAEKTSLRRSEALGTIKVAVGEMFKDQRILVQGRLADVGKNDAGQIYITLTPDMGFDYPDDGKRVLKVSVITAYGIVVTPEQAAALTPGALVMIGVSKPRFQHGTFVPQGAFARIEGGSALNGCLVAGYYKVRIGDVQFQSPPLN